MATFFQIHILEFIVVFLSRKLSDAFAVCLSCFPDFRLEGELISARIPHFFGQSWPHGLTSPGRFLVGLRVWCRATIRQVKARRMMTELTEEVARYRMKLRQPRVFRLEARGAVERLPSADSQAKPSADSQAMPFGWQPGCNFFAHGRTEFLWLHQTTEPWAEKNGNPAP